MASDILREAVDELQSAKWQIEHAKITIWGACPDICIEDLDGMTLEELWAFAKARHESGSDVGALFSRSDRQVHSISAALLA